MLLAHRRSGHRRERLGALLLAAVEVQHPDTAQIVVDRDEYQGLIATFRSLPKSDRELFAVVSWDGLSPTESADPLQINPENNGAGPSPRPDETNGPPTLTIPALNKPGDNAGAQPPGLAMKFAHRP
jgi:hypothetical protein